MGLFSRKPKEKEKCPVCGQELSLLKQTSIEGGTVFICDDCADKLRGQFGLESEWKNRGSLTEDRWVLKTEDRLREASLEEVKALIREREAVQAAAAEEFGGAFENIFKVDEVFTIAPKPMEVGLSRSRAYKNRRVVKGIMVKGSFTQKDTVKIQNGGTETEVQILELIPCDGIDFATNLQARLHKKTVEEGGDAWLVLDLTTDIPEGVVICK